MDAYTESWRLGLKAVAIYRDNSKRVQPLSSGTAKGEKKAGGRALRRCRDDRREDRLPAGAPQAARRARSRSRTSSRSAATKATSRSACIEDGTPGELFITHGEGRLDDLRPDG